MRYVRVLASTALSPESEPADAGQAVRVPALANASDAPRASNRPARRLQPPLAEKVDESRRNVSVGAVAGDADGTDVPATQTSFQVVSSRGAIAKRGAHEALGRTAATSSTANSTDERSIR